MNFITSFFAPSVNSLMSAHIKLVGKLEALAEQKLKEEAQHQTSINELVFKMGTLESERVKASKIASKLRSILDAE